MQCCNTKNPTYKINTLQKVVQLLFPLIYKKKLLYFIPKTVLNKLLDSDKENNFQLIKTISGEQHSTDL